MTWSTAKLGKLGSFKNGINFKSDRMGRGIPIINVKDITSAYRIDPNQLDLVDVQVDNSYMAQENDIFFVRSSVKLDGIGLVGKILPPFLGAVHCGFIIRFRPETQDIYSDYLIYLLRTPRYRQIIKNLSAGSAIVNISQTVLKNLKIPIPPNEIQKKITETISTYDDLIQNNRRRIELLEGSARLLYKEWFVHLRFPGHEHVKIKDGVPEGWEIRKIADIAETVGGGTPSTKVPEYWIDGNIVWFVPSDVTSNKGLILLDSEKKISETGFKKSSAKMLLPETILMTSRASIGYFGLFEKECCTNQGFISLIPRFNNTRMYMLFNLMNRKEEIVLRAGGTTYKEINKSTFRNMDILMPSKSLLIEFENYAYTFIKRNRLVKKQIKALTQARDLLLPRLMNGGIAV